MTWHVRISPLNYYNVTVGASLLLIEGWSSSEGRYSLDVTCQSGAEVARYAFDDVASGAETQVVTDASGRGNDLALYGGATLVRGEAWDYLAPGGCADLDRTADDDDGAACDAEGYAAGGALRALPGEGGGLTAAAWVRVAAYADWGASLVACHATPAAATVAWSTRESTYVASEGDAAGAAAEWHALAAAAPTDGYCDVAEGTLTTAGVLGNVALCLPARGDGDGEPSDEDVASHLQVEWDVCAAAGATEEWSFELTLDAGRGGFWRFQQLENHDYDGAMRGDGGASSCAHTCFGQTCDFWGLPQVADMSCETIEAFYDCDCAGCACDGGGGDHGGGGSGGATDDGEASSGVRDVWVWIPGPVTGGAVFTHARPVGHAASFTVASQPV